MSEHKRPKFSETTEEPNYESDESDSPPFRPLTSLLCRDLQPDADTSIIWPDSLIISILEKFKASTIQRSSSSPKTIADLNLSSSCFEVGHRDSSILIHEIDELVRSAEEAIDKDKGFCFSVPSRSNSNLLFVQELGRHVLGDKCSKISFKDASTRLQFQMILQVLSYVRKALHRNVLIVKTQIFYSDTKLFGDQHRTDDIVDDVSCMLRCTQSSLNIIPSGYGLVVGELMFRDKRDFIDCRKLGSVGKVIPSIISQATDFKSNDALFILLVQKSSVFAQLVRARFYLRFPCIIIMSKGQTDLSTRQFLSKLNMELKLPVLALVNCDPHALKILSIYKYGSYDSLNMTTPDIKWLGVRPSDLCSYSVPNEHLLDLQDSDISIARELMQEESIRLTKGWVDELQLMLKLKKKAETQVLSFLGFDFLTDVFLPKKLQELDLI